MTIEEAKKCLFDAIAVDCGRCYEHECDICDTQAKVMAIEALENCPPKDSICYGCKDNCNKCEAQSMLMV